MGRYFFHLVTGSERQEDDIGLDLDGVEAAYLQAAAAAHSMAGELVRDGIDLGRCGFEICDANGELLIAPAFDELYGRRPGRPPSGQATARLALALEDTHRRASDARRDMAAGLVQARASIDEAYGLIASLRVFERSAGTAEETGALLLGMGTGRC